MCYQPYESRDDNERISIVDTSGLKKKKKSTYLCGCDAVIVTVLDDSLASVLEGGFCYRTL